MRSDRREFPPLEGSAGRGRAREHAPSAVQRILRNGTFNLLGQGAYGLCHVIAIFALARALGRAGFGVYYTLFALILVVQLIVEMGVGTVLTRRLIRAPERWEETIGEATGLYSFIALASGLLILGLGIGWGLSQGDRTILDGDAGVSCTPGWLAFAGAGLACAALQIQRYCASVLQALESFGYENIARVLQGTIYVALILTLVEPGQTGLGSVLVLLALSHVAAALFLAGSLGWRLRCFNWRFRLPVRDWLKEAVPLGFGDVVRGLTWQLDTVLLALLQPAAVVGIYSVAYRPLGPLNWLPRAVLTATFPAFTRMATRDSSELGRAFAHSTRLLWIVSLPIAIAICLSAEPLILLLAGPEYLPAVLPMRALIWIAVLSFLSMQFRFLFTAIGRQRLYAWLVVLVFMVEAIVETVLIPWWGYWGACAGTMLGELLFTVLGLVLCYQVSPMGISWRALARALLAAAVMGFVLWPARDTSWPILLLALAGSTGLYFALCVGLGALDRGDVQHGFTALVRFVWPSARVLQRRKEETLAALEREDGASAATQTREEEHAPLAD
jgi:O-antigen/teichoic acid export membrane protein